MSFTRALHALYLAQLAGHALASATDGGPSDLNRSHKRVAGKRQRQARKIQRRARS